MRGRILLAWVSVLAVCGGSGVSCIFTYDLTSCDDYPMPGCPGVSTVADGGDGGPDGDSGPDGEDGPPPSCIPSLSSTPVADSCGVFVSSSTGSDTTGMGTKEAPYKTITAALAKGSILYACAGATPFSEALAVPPGTTIFGGLDCSSWSYVGATTKTTVTAGAGQIPVTLAAGSGAKLVDLHVLAADASSMNDGTSSIAMVANGATAELDGCVVEAQGGAAGAAGQNFSMVAQAGAMGASGGDACTAATVNGGAPVSSMCGTPDSVSGNGGQGFGVSGGSGSPGSPLGAMNGGSGDTGSGCSTGTKGNDGSPGTPGKGAATTDLGTVSATGYTGVTGKIGGAGTPGQGGGGGGGAKGGTGAGMCTMAATSGGAAGGSGGSGGCGGTGGKGGSPGGSSIAIINLGATLTMSNVTLKAGGGGAGGNGGAGQTGGGPGLGGNGGKVLTATSLNPGCGGGPGGLGGNGGKGGGGRGGHAIGIAYTGTTAPSMMGVTFVMGTAGAGGKGDNSMGNMGDGAQGIMADLQGF
jgi:hypothetical protein